MVRVGGLGLAVAFALGCGPGYKELKVDDIDGVSVAIDDPEQQFCAYAPVALRAEVTYRDGKRALSRTPGEGAKHRLRTSEFRWSSSQGSVDERAVLALPHEPLEWYDEPVIVAASVAAKPELAAETALEPRFDCGGTLDLRGAAGARGGEAEYGGHGAPGPDVEVALAYVASERRGRLVLVRVRRGDRTAEHYLIAADSAQAPFTIDARGGDGGAGGQGVVGAAGTDGFEGEAGVDGDGCADGTDGQPGTDGTPGGPGGPGAGGGDGGRGGSVTLRYDARFAELPSRVLVLVDGGGAGPAGPGGPGGPGGRAGAGGRAGKAGTEQGDAAEACPAKDGAAGQPGAAGESGQPGQPGRPGQPGQRGELRGSPEGVDALFAAEIARGVPVEGDREGTAATGSARPAAAREGSAP